MMGKMNELTNTGFKPGIVQVEYEAPDICGQDSDQMIVKNVCENTEDGTLELDKEISKKKLKLEKVSCDLSVNIRAAFQWKDEQSNAVVEGNAQMSVKGSMKFDESIQLPFVKRYTPQNLVVSWSKKVKGIEKDPDDGCPEVLYEYMGGGSSSIPDPAYQQSSSFEIHRFGDMFPKNMPIPIPAEAKSQMADSLEIWDSPSMMWGTNRF